MSLDGHDTITCFHLVCEMRQLFCEHSLESFCCPCPDFFWVVRGTLSSTMAYHDRLFCLCDSGHETKAMMNNSGPRYKRSQLERRLNTDIMWCVVLLIVMCMTAAIGEYCHLLIHHTAATAGNCLIFRGWVSWAAMVSLFTRSRSLEEQSEGPCFWDRLTLVTCLSWLPCLLDYDHRAAGEVSTFIHF